METKTGKSTTCCLCLVASSCLCVQLDGIQLSVQISFIITIEAIFFSFSLSPFSSTTIFKLPNSRKLKYARLAFSSPPERKSILAAAAVTLVYFYYYYFHFSAMMMIMIVCVFFFRLSLFCSLVRSKNEKTRNRKTKQNELENGVSIFSLLMAINDDDFNSMVFLPHCPATNCT